MASRKSVRKSRSSRPVLEHPYPPSQIYRGSTRLRQQVRDMREGNRGLVAHWFKPNFVPITLPTPQSSVSGARSFARMRQAYNRLGSHMTNGSIARTGNVPRSRGEGVRTLDIPVSSGKFFEYMETVLGRGTQRRLQRKTESFRSSKSRREYERAHARGTYNFGLNCILEVGNDGSGNPTHILVMKRPPTVPIEPNVHDFPAGLVRKLEKGKSPLDSVNKRLEGETGIPASKLQIVGPGLVPTREEIYFTLQRLDRLANYNPVIIQRALVDAEVVRKDIQSHIDARKAKKDPFAPVGFELIPRNPTAIAQFARTHHTFMPEVLRLYAQELNKHRPREKSR